MFSSCFCNLRARAASSFSSSSFVSISFGDALAAGPFGLTSDEAEGGADLLLGKVIFDLGAAALACVVIFIFSSPSLLLPLCSVSLDPPLELFVGVGCLSSVVITPGVTTVASSEALVPALASSAEVELSEDFCFFAAFDLRPAVSHSPSSDRAAAFAPLLPPSSDRTCIIARRSSSLYDVSSSSSVPLSPEDAFAGMISVPVEGLAKGMSLSAASGLTEFSVPELSSSSSS
mmetsp:Transcript_25250/g.73068  ORF Transcript_25250/g.73068 Transcript_25250/m.73068 type:complete len:232 (-) Transcript_25250:1136-1831(-)